MKVNISYDIRIKKEIEITPEEYCYLHASSQYGDYFPEDSFNRYIELPISSKDELEDYFYRKKQNRAANNK